MSTYRAGQRVRIEWPTGEALEGSVRESDGAPHAVISFGECLVPLASTLAGRDGRTITVLSEPEEPTGLGAVVEASARGVYLSPPDERVTWLRVHGGYWERNSGAGVAWKFLVDPVILHEGWNPDE